MKKILIIITLLSLIILVGCVNYKTYTQQNTDDQQESNLLKEIEAIEKELELDAQEMPEEVKTVEEEIIIPELEEPTQSSEEKVVNIKETERVSLKPKLLDPDNDPITVTYSKPLNEQGEWQTNYGDAGEYVVTISATDGKMITTKDVKLIVAKVNVAPTIENLVDINVNEGETVTFIPVTTDLNGDKVIVTVSKPLDNGNFITDYSSAGEYKIKVTASDGELESEKSFTLTIADVNQKPVFSALEDITIKEGETLKLKPEVTDLDGDNVKISISEPVGDDGEWKLSYTDNGEYMITLTANDGKDIVTKKVKVTVVDVNAPVEFLDINIEIN
jgi:hypothetical protein